MEPMMIAPAQSTTCHPSPLNVTPVCPFYSSLTMFQLIRLTTIRLACGEALHPWVVVVVVIIARARHLPVVIVWIHAKDIVEH